MFVDDPPGFEFAGASAEYKVLLFSHSASFPLLPFIYPLELASIILSSLGPGDHIPSKPLPLPPPRPNIPTHVASVFISFNASPTPLHSLSKTLALVMIVLTPRFATLLLLVATVHAAFVPQRPGSQAPFHVLSTSDEGPTLYNTYRQALNPFRNPFFLRRSSTPAPSKSARKKSGTKKPKSKASTTAPIPDSAKPASERSSAPANHAVAGGRVKHAPGEHHRKHKGTSHGRKHKGNKKHKGRRVNMSCVYVTVSTHAHPLKLGRGRGVRKRSGSSPPSPHQQPRV